MPSRYNHRLKKVEVRYNVSSEGNKLLLKLPSEIRALIRSVPPHELYVLAERLARRAKKSEVPGLLEQVAKARRGSGAE